MLYQKNNNNKKLRLLVSCGTLLKQGWFGVAISERGTLVRRGIPSPAV